MGHRKYPADYKESERTVKVETPQQQIVPSICIILSNLKSKKLPDKI